MAIFHKLKNIFTCKQKYTNHCKSSLGNIYFDKVSESFFPCHRYDSLQKQFVKSILALENNSESGGESGGETSKCVSKYDHENKNKKYHRKSGGGEIRKVTTWNVQELWWYCYKGNKIQNIINYINDCDSDVICLQEVFEPKSLWLITNNYLVYKKYPYFLSGDMHNRFFVGENSGLLVLSKKPIVFHQFTPFMKSKCPDFYAAKGALYFSVGKYNFITTHLQSGNIYLAISQLEFILRKSPFNTKTILLGDLNMTDPFTGMRVDTNLQKHTHDSGRLLDHVISIQSDIPMNVDVDYINLKDVSDHFPVHGEIV